MTKRKRGPRRKPTKPQTPELPKRDPLDVLLEQVRDAIALAGFQAQYATLGVALISQEMKLRGILK